MYIKQLISELLLEGFKDDQKELAEKYQNFAPQIMELDPPCIAWLIKRFGKEKSIKETHPIDDCIGIVKSFKNASNGLSQKWATNEQFKTDVDAYYVAQGKERKWNNPADFQTMTVDEMTTIIALASKKKQRVNLVGSEGGKKELIGKVGPWNVWLPHTMKDSIDIAGYNPVTMEPYTTWCTNYTSQSNLFYNYNSGDQLLFYIIRDNPRPKPDPAGKFDFMSIGFKNGKMVPGSSGGVTIDRDNKGMTTQQHQEVLGQYYDEIMSLMFAKIAENGGVSPAADYSIKAATNLHVLKEMLITLSAQQRKTEAQRIYKDVTSANKSFSNECATLLVKFISFTDIAYNENHDSAVVNAFLETKADELVNGNSYSLKALFKKPIKIQQKNAKNIWQLFHNCNVEGDEIFSMLHLYDGLLNYQDNDTKTELLSFGSPYAKIQKAYDYAKSSNQEEIHKAFKFALEKNYSTLVKEVSVNNLAPLDIVLEMLKNSFRLVKKDDRSFYSFIFTNEELQQKINEDMQFFTTLPYDICQKIANAYIKNYKVAPPNKTMQHIVELCINFGSMPYLIKEYLAGINLIELDEKNAIIWNSSNSRIQTLLLDAISSKNKFLRAVPDDSKVIFNLNDTQKSAEQEVPQHTEFSDLFKENHILDMWQKIIL